jgi:kumamolisin
MFSGFRPLLATLAVSVLMLPAAASAADARALPGSVRLPDSNGVTLGSASIVRRTLTAAELAQPMSFSVTLRMRDFQGLQARIASGARIPQAEMEANYLPLRADYERVGAWLSSEGFTPTLKDMSHTSVFVRGDVADIARAFGVPFARVLASDGEYTSAVAAPQVPADLAPVVLSVNGLQPQFRLRHITSAALSPDDLVQGAIYVTPDNLNSAYDIPASATGAGQFIAVVGEAPVASSDLSAFWSAVGVAQSAGNVSTINVDSTSPSSGLTEEAALDVEWAGAMAPGAGIRYYVARNVFDCFTQVMNDLPAFPTMRVLSVSFGDTEGDQGSDTLQAFAQFFAQFAASGVSVLAASGDSGSNPSNGVSAGGFSSSSPLQVNYPASDPSVTGVGGTTLTFTGNWRDLSEVVWDDISVSQSASGGGVSNFFQKPSWQVGGTVLAGQTMRCVPDVAAISIADLQNVNVGSAFQPANGTDIGVLIFSNGKLQARAGTSLSCPVWAAVVTLINQARTANGAPSIGLLNPAAYPLMGSSAFNDITSGSNGAYAAGPGYDLCSGLGSPNVANLISALGGGVASSHRLVNLSTRAEVETGSNIVIAGFVVQGAGSKSILLRGVGPALAALGVAGVLAQPVLGVYDSTGALIATDAGWGNPPTAGTSGSGAAFRQATAADMSSVGAFALAAGSADSAMVLTLPAGSYTEQISGVGGSTGVALAEVYETSTKVPIVLSNISARCSVGANANVAISGFVVSGNQSAELLIRGVGPGLGAFGVSGVLAQPSIGLFDSGGAQIASNTGWTTSVVTGTSAVAATVRLATAADMSSVGAFALAPGSADSALVASLPPGQYTAIISGVAGSTGTGLAEVYELSGH